MASDPPPSRSPNRPGIGPDPTTVPPASPRMAPSPGEPLPAPARQRHRLRRIAAAVLILAGLALLIVTLRAQDLGLASTAGPSWTQVTTGVVGTVLVACGLALIVQPFENSAEPPSVG